MGCLGASSRSVTLLAAVLSIVASVHFIVYDALLMTAIKYPKSLDSYAVKKDVANCELASTFLKFEKCIVQTPKDSTSPVVQSSNPTVNISAIKDCLQANMGNEEWVDLLVGLVTTCDSQTCPKNKEDEQNENILDSVLNNGDCLRELKECRANSVDRKGIIDSFQCLRKSEDIILPLCAIRLVLSLCWIGSAVVLLYGNKKNKKTLILQWIPCSIINLLYHIGIVCYGISRLVNFSKEKFTESSDGKAEVITFIAFHDWGIIWWITAGILTFNVYRRAYSKDEDEFSLSDGSSSFRSFEAVRPGEAPGELEPIETVPKMKFLVDGAQDHESSPPAYGESASDKRRKGYPDHSEILRDPQEDKLRRKHPEREPSERPEAWGDSGRPNDPRQQNQRGKNGFPAFSGADRGERMRRDPSNEERERLPRGEDRTRKGPDDGRSDRPRRRGPEEGREDPLGPEARRNRKEPRHDYRSAYDDYIVQSRPNDETQSNYEPRRRPEYEPRQLDTASLVASIPRATTPSDRDYRRRKEIPLSNWHTPSRERESGTGRSERSDHPRGARSREKSWTAYNGAYRNPVFEEDEPDYDPVPTQHSRHHPDEKASRF